MYYIVLHIEIDIIIIFVKHLDHFIENILTKYCKSCYVFFFLLFHDNLLRYYGYKLILRL